MIPAKVRVYNLDIKFGAREKRAKFTMKMKIFTHCVKIFTLYVKIHHEFHFGLKVMYPLISSQFSIF
jgi:hypothetical protein